MSESMWLPSVSHFLNGNGWTGSEGLLRFQLDPPVDGKLTAVVWQDPFTRQYAEELARADFDVSDDGLNALKLWLTQQATALNANPPRTAQQLRAYHDEAKAKEAAAE